MPLPGLRPEEQAPLGQPRTDAEYSVASAFIADDITVSDDTSRPQ
jgi:hypothetical protein